MEEEKQITNNQPVDFEVKTDGKKTKKVKEKIPMELTDEQVQQLAAKVDPNETVKIMKFLRNMPRKQRRRFMKQNRMPKLLAGYISKEHNDLLTKQMKENIIPIVHPKVKKYMPKEA